MGGPGLTPAFPPAVILAGGLGTRLRSVVGDLPKPMAPVNGKPFLERLVAIMAAQGMRDFVFCVGYGKEIVMRHFGDGASLNVRVRYAVEDRLLGTGGAVRNAKPFLDGSFFLLNGDTFLELDYRALLEFHRRRCGDGRVAGTIALVRSSSQDAFGSIEIDSSGRVNSFSEKSAGRRGPGWINGGVYVLEPAIFGLVPAGGPSSLERDVIPAALSRGITLYGFPVSGAFVDIGTPEGYREIAELMR